MTMEKKLFTPAIVVTSEKWSHSCAVVSYDDEWIPPEWVAERRDEIQREAYENGDETEIDYNAVLTEMRSEFESDNDTVDDFWHERGILRTGEHYFKYDTDNGSWVKYLGEYGSLNECISDHEIV